MKRSSVVLCVFAALASLSACSGGQQTTTENTQTLTSSPPPSGGSSETPAAASTAPVASAEPSASASPEPTASSSPPPVELPPMPANLHAPARPWARMNARQRSQYMEHDVLPVFRELLRAYDSNRYPSVTCATCHGDNARTVHFRMPNTLPGLHPYGSEAANRAHAENPRIFAFMAQRVTPAMAQLLGEQPFNPQTNQGFGCYNCHPHAP